VTRLAIRLGVCSLAILGQFHCYARKTLKIAPTVTAVASREAWLVSQRSIGVTSCGTAR